MTHRRRPVRQLLGPLVLATVLLAACGGGGGKGTSSGTGAGGSTKGLAVPANEGIDGVMAIRVTSRQHTLGTVQYDIHPPAGGDHNPSPAPCGFYDQVVPDEYVVHTLEHGGVWLAYAQTLPAADVAKLHKLADDNDNLIATPYKGLAPGVAVVVTAWARQLRLTSVDDPRLLAFYTKYKSGSQAPESSIGCPRRP